MKALCYKTNMSEKNTLTNLFMLKFVHTFVPDVKFQNPSFVIIDVV